MYCSKIKVPLPHGVLCEARVMVAERHYGVVSGTGSAESSTPQLVMGLWLRGFPMVSSASSICDVIAGIGWVSSSLPRKSLRVSRRTRSRIACWSPPKTARSASPSSSSVSCSSAWLRSLLAAMMSRLRRATADPMTNPTPASAARPTPLRTLRDVSADITAPFCTSCAFGSVAISIF